MKLKFVELIKKIEINKTKDTIKTYLKDNYKMVGSVAVVTALAAVCTVSAVGNIAKNNSKTGIIMTVSDVAADEVAYAGNTFDVTTVSYNEMKLANYEAGQLANLEKAEKQVDEILSSKRQDKKDQAIIDALTAQTTTEPTTETYQGATATAANTAPVVTTYADENGTYYSIGDFVLTAYCPCPICCGVYSNMENPTTASGTRATAGRTIAADTSVLPFGTEVVINGQVYTVEDRGGAIQGNRIDVYFNSHQDALQFGRQIATVYIQQ